jgi:hypothetical protein
MERQNAALVAQARLLSYPPLWCWEIVDGMTGVLVASSWEGASDAYNSADEALGQAALALRQLAGRRGRKSPLSATPPMAMGA